MSGRSQEKLNNLYVQFTIRGQKSSIPALIPAIRASIEKKNRDANLAAIMDRINLDSPMMVFRDDELSADRVLH